ASRYHRDLPSFPTRRSSDLVDGGWVINGTKIWTSGAAEATHILGLFRTSENKHAGLTQFIIDCNTPGMAISPIAFIDGSRDFCEDRKSTRLNSSHQIISYAV